jgi:hypothetical protein
VCRQIDLYLLADSKEALIGDSFSINVGCDLTFSKKTKDMKDIVKVLNVGHRFLVRH